MLVWLVQPGEPLPTDPGTPRLLRTGLLAEQLLAEGHEVVWWATSFDHANKTHRTDAHAEIAVREGYRLVLLHSPGYRANISLARLRDHRIIGRELRKRLLLERRPDVIHCSFPTIELAFEVARYSLATGVPYVLDARDMWPDIFLDAVPARLRALTRLVLSHDFRMTRMAFRNATAITAHAPGFVDWGLQHAGRPAGPLDVDFPFSYPVVPVPAADLAAARLAWSEQGVSSGSEHFNICFFGTFADRDEVDLRTVIEAARIVASQRPRLRFVLCGSGPRLETMRSLARALPNVLLPGRVDLARIRALMERSKLGLLPYLPSRDFLASLPNKAVEYLSGGLPVLTSLCGGYLEQILRREQCGLFYRGGDAAGLAAVLGAALNEEDSMRARSVAARRAFESSFRADVVASKMIRHLDQVRGTCRSTPGM